MFNNKLYRSAYMRNNIVVEKVQLVLFPTRHNDTQCHITLYYCTDRKLIYACNVTYTKTIVQTREMFKTLEVRWLKCLFAFVKKRFSCSSFSDSRFEVSPRSLCSLCSSPRSVPRYFLLDQ